MAGMTELLPKRALTDDFALRAWAAEALAAREITRSQWAAIVDAFAPHVPVTLSLVYRTPKGVLYVNEFNPDTARMTTYYLNHRARWIKKTPPPAPQPSDAQPERQTWKLV